VGAVASALGLALVVPDETSEASAAATLLAVADGVRAGSPTDRASSLWAIYAGVSTVFPDEDTVLELSRRCELQSLADFCSWLLERGIAEGARHGSLLSEIEIVPDAVLFDVDFSARNDHNTGIQRVARNSLPHLLQRPSTIPVAWTNAFGAYRRLTPKELARASNGEGSADASSGSESPQRIVVPIRSSVVLLEVPDRAALAGLLGLARFSGNTVSAVGYDTIPITSRSAVSRAETNRFAEYLSVVKYMRWVAGISDAARGEFAGFAAMLPSQGLTGPTVVEVLLPSDPPHSVPLDRDASDRPLVLCVGSKEPRKNHVSVLVAAEQLWREGFDFELLFVGSYGPDTTGFRRWLSRLVKMGRPVSAPPRVSDDELWAAYSRARFSVFPSVHEGFGLPVAESLRYGTPVITSRFGSTAEIAREGGCMLVDPRSDASLLSAMRTLLENDVLLAALKREAHARPARTWSNYADDLWHSLEVAR
jgi:glycosyltransferase involved in cell wall biosynthesis